MSQPLKQDSVTCPARCCEQLALHPTIEMVERFAMNGSAESDFVLDMLLERSDLPSEPEPFYACKHLDRATKRCTVYEIRPQMCRDYPGDAPCKWCTYDPKTENAGSFREGIGSTL